MSIKVKSILSRLFKGFLSGAVTTMLMITIAAPANWTDLANAINILSIAGISGGINGALLAAQKWLSWKEEVIS